MPFLVTLCQVRLNIKQPRVGLLTIGTNKARALQILRKHTNIYLILMVSNYAVGLIEGFQLFDGDIDVVV